MCRTNAPEIGQFISPDPLVPDPGNLFDYNRYLYARANPMRYNDPSGHCVTFVGGLVADVVSGGAALVFSPVELGIDAACWAAVTEAVSLLVSTFGPQLPAVADPNVVYLADQAANHSAQQGTGQQNAGNSGNSTNSGGDPNDLWNRFRKAGLQNNDINELRNASAKNSNFSLDKAYQQLDFFKRSNVQISGHALAEAQAESISAQNILNTFNRVQGYGTQVFESAEPGRVVVWSSVQRLAVVVESSTQKIVTVFNRPTPQNTWTQMNPLQIPSWLQLK